MSSFTVRWSPSSGAEFYTIGVRINANPWVETNTGLNRTYFQDGLIAGDVIDVRVRASNETGDGAWSPIYTIVLQGAFPIALSGLIAIGQTGQIRLEWTDNSSVETSYEVYRSVGGIGNPNTWTWTLIDTIPADSEFYVDPQADGTKRYYRVVAVSPRGVNPEPEDVTPVYATTTPPAPVAASADNITISGFRARWSLTSGATSYRIDVSESNIFDTFVLENANTGTSFSAPYYVYNVSGLDSNKDYYYRLRAVNAAGTSPNSNVINVKTVAEIPATPTGLDVFEQGVNSWGATWNSVTGADGYNIRWRVNGDSWITLDRGSNESYNSPFVYDDCDQIDVQVQAYNTGGESAWSATQTVFINCL